MDCRRLAAARPWPGFSRRYSRNGRADSGELPADFPADVRQLVVLADAGTAENLQLHKLVQRLKVPLGDFPITAIEKGIVMAIADGTPAGPGAPLNEDLLPMGRRGPNHVSLLFAERLRVECGVPIQV